MMQEPAQTSLYEVIAWLKINWDLLVGVSGDTGGKN